MEFCPREPGSRLEGVGVDAGARVFGHQQDGERCELVHRVVFLEMAAEQENPGLSPDSRRLLLLQALLVGVGLAMRLGIPGEDEAVEEEAGDPMGPLVWIRWCGRSRVRAGELAGLGAVAMTKRMLRSGFKQGAPGVGFVSRADWARPRGVAAQRSAVSTLHRARRRLHGLAIVWPRPGFPGSSLDELRPAPPAALGSASLCNSLTPHQERRFRKYLKGCEIHPWSVTKGAAGTKLHVMPNAKRSNRETLGGLNSQNDRPAAPGLQVEHEFAVQLRGGLCFSGGIHLAALSNT